MGLFDSIAGNLLGSVLGGGQSGSGLAKLASDVMSGNHGELSTEVSGLLASVGGIDGLVQKAQQGGLGEVVGSWVGTGANQPISSEQVTQLLGSDVIQHVASRFGIDVNQAAPLVATMLPAIIDRLTPNGQVSPDAHNLDAVHAAIGGLVQGGGLMKLLGGLLGGSKPA